MVTVSPPVSPSVVAAILMIQNPSVTAGTLLIVEWAFTHRTSQRRSWRANVRQRNQRRRATERAFPRIRGVGRPGNGFDRSEREIVPAHTGDHAMDKALSGIRIIDMTHNQAGPACAQILAFLGADVIKLDEPTGGDGARRNMRDKPDSDSLLFLLFNTHNASPTTNPTSKADKRPIPP